MHTQTNCMSQNLSHCHVTLLVTPFVIVEEGIDKKKHFMNNAYATIAVSDKLLCLTDSRYDKISKQYCNYSADY